MGFDFFARPVRSVPRLVSRVDDVAPRSAVSVLDSVVWPHILGCGDCIQKVLCAGGQVH